MAHMKRVRALPGSERHGVDAPRVKVPARARVPMDRTQALSELKKLVQSEGMEASSVQGQIEMAAWDLGYQIGSGVEDRVSKLPEWLLFLGQSEDIDVAAEFAAGLEAGGGSVSHRKSGDGSGGVERLPVPVGESAGPVGPQRVVVWGTGVAGGENHWRLGGAKKLGQVRIPGYARRDVKMMSPAIHPDPEGVVEGELYEMDPEALLAFDAYEGVDWRRTRVRLDDGTDAWTYVYRGPVGGDVDVVERLALPSLPKDLKARMKAGAIKGLHTGLFPMGIKPARVATRFAGSLAGGRAGAEAGDRLFGAVARAVHHPDAPPLPVDFDTVPDRQLQSVIERLPVVGGGRGGRDNAPRIPHSQVQTLLFERKHFDVDTAKAWAKGHGFKYGKVKKYPNTIRIRQRDPNEFIDSTFGTIRFKPGLQAVVAVPTDRADDRTDDGVGVGAVERLPASEPWITKPGALGGPGYLSKSWKARKTLLDASVKRDGYRTTIGRIMVLERNRAIQAEHGDVLEHDRDYLRTRYGGEGSYGVARLAADYDDVDVDEGEPREVESVVERCPYVPNEPVGAYQKRDHAELGYLLGQARHELVEAAEGVAGAAGAGDDVKQARKAWRAFVADLNQHLTSEEDDIFPAWRKSHPSDSQKIDKFLREHEVIRARVEDVKEAFGYGNDHEWTIAAIDRLFEVVKPHDADEERLWPVTPTAPGVATSTATDGRAR